VELIQKGGRRFEDHMSKEGQQLNGDQEELDYPKLIGEKGENRPVNLRTL